MAKPTDTVRRSYEALGQTKVAAVISILDKYVECTEASVFRTAAVHGTRPEQ